MIAEHELISPRYLQLQRALHAQPRGYGGRGDKWAGVVLHVAMDYQATSILDYGCGQGSLARALRSKPFGVEVTEYDPAIAGKDALPSAADLVVCTDVLEHIEPERLSAVLQHLRSLARKAIFVVISTKDSNKTLADGRNAHLIIEHGSWWKQQLRDAGFTLHNPPTIVRHKEHEWVGVLTP